MKKYTLNANIRDLLGRKVKTLRNDGLAPANIFGKNVKSTSIQINTKEFQAVYKEAGETSIVELNLGKDIRHTLISNVQLHPVTDEILHVDFREVNLKEKITAQVPVELEGESQAEKSGVGTVVTQLSEIEVEALPTDIPENFTINIESLSDVDQAIYVKDIKAPSGVTITEDSESIVVKVEPQQKEEVIVEPVAAEGEQTAETATNTGETTEEAKEEKAPEA